MPYMDYAGAALPSEALMESIGEFLKNHKLSNPHSHHSTSTITKQIVDNARQRILSHFNAEDYAVVFTQNATQSLKIIAECFNFAEKEAKGCEITNELKSGASFSYLADSHHSLLGMRETIVERADWICCLQDLPKDIPSTTGSLFALTAMSNFCGRKYDLDIVPKLQREGWSVCLDAAALVASSLLNLKIVQPDFVVFSFYKLFGYPTGLGALLIRKDSAVKLSKKAFAGGSVSAVLPSRFVVKHRESIEERFEDGTINYYAIAALQKGFDDLSKHGGINKIGSHSYSIAKEAFDMLKNKFHWNGKPAALLYSRNQNFGSQEEQGPVVTFNLLREDGSFTGYAEVSKMADLFGIDLRTGCFCNIGACQYYLQLSDEDVLANIESGKRCGDEQDLLDGRPTGAVRVSFGRESTKQDVLALEQMIDYCFLGQRHSPVIEHPLDISCYKPSLSKMICYPIKSCRGVYLKRSKLMSSGLEFDRQFMVVHNDSTMSQKKYPQLCRIRTELKDERLLLSSEGENSLEVDFEPKMINGINGTTSVVCTNTVPTNDCGDAAASWISNVLDMTQCRLRRTTADAKRSLSNEAPYLLVNEASAQLMASHLNLSLDDIITRFRPNLIVRGLPAFIEDTAKSLQIGDAEFEVTGKCTRCEMICVNQATGEKDPRLIVTLRDLRDRQKMTFGIYVEEKTNHGTRISAGDRITFK